VPIVKGQLAFGGSSPERAAARAFVAAERLKKGHPKMPKKGKEAGNDLVGAARFGRAKGTLKMGA
jgi:hypothetical protein